MSAEDNVLKKVAIKIKELRGDMTQKEFAAMLGVSPQAVSEWENANKMPRMGIIEKLSIRYNVPKSYVLGENNIESATPFGQQLTGNKDSKGNAMVFANTLRRIMDEKGIKASELSRLSGVTEASISEYLNGKKEPMGKQSIAIAKALNVSLDELWETGFKDYSLEELKSGFLRIHDGVITEYNKLNEENKKVIDANIDFLLNQQNQSRE